MIAPGGKGEIARGCLILRPAGTGNGAIRLVALKMFSGQVVDRLKIRFAAAEDRN